MMDSFTLKNLKRDKKQDNLFNIFKQTMVDAKIILYTTYVNIDEEMRLDKVSSRLYGTPKYIEELMQINNILNIWNVKQGDIIQYGEILDFQLLKSLEKEVDDIYEKIAKQNKNTRIDKDRNKNVPPTIKPKNLENLTIDKKTKRIKIQGRIS